MLFIIACILTSASSFSCGEILSISRVCKSTTSPERRGMKTPGVEGTILVCPPCLGAFTTVLKSPNGEPFADIIFSPSLGFLIGIDWICSLDEFAPEGVWNGRECDWELFLAEPNTLVIPVTSLLDREPPIAPLVTASKLSPNSSWNLFSDIFFTWLGNLISSRWNACWIDVTMKSESFWSW